MDGAAGLLTAAGAFVSAVIGAVVLIIRELRRNPRKSDRIIILLNLLSRVRDWLQGNGLWEDVPKALRGDVERELDQNTNGRTQEGSSDDRAR